MTGDDSGAMVRQRSEYRGGASEGGTSSLLLARQRVAWIAACMMPAMLVLRTLRTAGMLASVGLASRRNMLSAGAVSSVAVRCAWATAEEEEVAVAAVLGYSGGTGDMDGVFEGSQ